MTNHLSFRTAIRSFMLLVACMCMHGAFGLDYYSRQSGLWNDPLSWSTVSHADSMNAGSVPGPSDNVFVGDGHSIELAGTCQANNLTVGNGVSGMLFFSGAATVLVEVFNNLTIRSGGVLKYDHNAGLVHDLRINGNLVNNGNCDLVNDINDHVRLSFVGEKHSRVSEASGSTAGTWQLNRVNLEKSVQKSYRLESTVFSFEEAIGQLEVIYGTYQHNNRGTFLVNPSAGALTVGPNAVFQVSLGVMHLSPSADMVYLQGKLIVSRGTMRVGSFAGRVGLLYEQMGIVAPEVNVFGGTLVVYGGFRPNAGHETDPVVYTQTAGSMKLNSGNTGTALATFLISPNPSSSFQMNGGLINIERTNTSANAYTDLDLGSGVAAINAVDGSVVFGNNSTPSGTVFTFTPISGLSLPHFTVSGSGAGSASLRPSVGSADDVVLASLKIESGKSFDIRSVSGAPYDSRTLTLNNYFDNVHAFFNDGSFVSRTGTVVLEGNEGLGIGGSNVTTFHNLTINTPDGVALWKTAEVSNLLNMTDGKLFTSVSSPVVLLSDAQTYGGSVNSFIDGPAHCWIASPQPTSILLPVGKNNAYRPVQISVDHSNAVPVLYKTEVVNQSARAMGYTVPSSLTHVSAIRYYLIERDPVPNLTQASLMLTYGNDDDVTDYRGLRIASDNGSNLWVDLGGVATGNGSGSIASASFTSFNSIFTLANAAGFSNPLPVELLGFTAKVQKEVVVLDWSTASELNSDFFEVQRSTDGFNYTALGRVTAAGSSNVLRRYAFNDNQPARGVNYYRLRQVDIDGSETYSPIRSVIFIPGRVTVYPNPVADRVVQVNIPEVDEAMNISLLRADGSLVIEQVQTVFLAGNTEFHLSEAVQPGCYLLRLQSATGQVWQERLVVAQ